MKLAWISAAFLLTSAASAVELGDKFPAKTIKHIEKGQISTGDMAGKVTIINFWATWCEACKVEIVEMEDLFRPYVHDKNFQMVFVSLDKDPSKAKEWFASNLKKPDEMTKFLYSDKTFALAEELSIDSFPMTMIIEPNGKIGYIQKGFVEGEGSTEKMVAHSAKVLKTTKQSM